MNSKDSHPTNSSDGDVTDPSIAFQLVSEKDIDPALFAKLFSEFKEDPALDSSNMKKENDGVLETEESLAQCNLNKNSDNIEEKEIHCSVKDGSSEHETHSLVTAFTE